MDNDVTVEPENDADQSAQADIEQLKAATNTKSLKLQAGYHLVGLVSAVAMWGAADTWVLTSELTIAALFSVIASIVFGVAMAHIIHEWSHFLGAVIAEANYTVKKKPAFLFFDFDYVGNTQRQFLWMSSGGFAGNCVLIAIVWLAIPLDSAGRGMLLATVIGMAVYVAVLEGPVIRRTRAGEDSLTVLTEHFGQGDILFNRATQWAVGVGLVCWLLVS